MVPAHQTIPHGRPVPDLHDIFYKTSGTSQSHHSPCISHARLVPDPHNILVSDKWYWPITDSQHSFCCRPDPDVHSIGQLLGSTSQSHHSPCIPHAWLIPDPHNILVSDRWYWPITDSQHSFCCRPDPISAYLLLLARPRCTFHRPAVG